jgi:Raf kinase inhibitor-like YbhB/YbcL family protein
MMTTRWAPALSLFLIAACGGRPAQVEGPGEPTTGAPDPLPDEPETVMTLASPDFADGEPIPRKHAYEGEGQNEPPRLGWSNLPGGTVELALIVDDPDAPGDEPWVHDVLYKIPPDATPELMVIRGAAVDSVALYFEGTNSWGEAGWGGPKPPPGKAHHYVFTLYALDAELDLLPGATRAELVEAMQGHVLGTAVLTGTYER